MPYVSAVELLGRPPPRKIYTHMPSGRLRSRPLDPTSTPLIPFTLTRTSGRAMRLGEREQTLLQGFPGQHRFAAMCSRTEISGQMGNAVPPSAMSVIYRCIV